MIVIQIVTVIVVVIVIVISNVEGCAGTWGVRARPRERVPEGPETTRTGRRAERGEFRVAQTCPKTPF